MIISDSTVVAGNGQVVGTEMVTEQPKSFKPRHPYQVLRLLPKNATPAQQDSAIQAAFQPKEVRYSDRPDTLHLPGYGKGKSALEITPLPTYYKESFFAADSLFHPERSVGRYGVAGETVPYTVRGDSTMSLLLVMCFIAVTISASGSRNFIVKQLKSIIYVPKNYGTMMSETSQELHFQLFMLLLTSLLYSILFYYYATRMVSDTFVVASQYHLTAIFFAMSLGYFLTKGLLYLIVNTIFFTGKKNLQWIKSSLFLTTSEGMLLFPIILLLSYFDLEVKNALISVGFVLFLIKILTFLKSYFIFFRRKGYFLQNILYFCALEMVPLLSLWGSVVLVSNYLKINF